MTTYIDEEHIVQMVAKDNKMFLEDKGIIVRCKDCAKPDDRGYCKVIGGNPPLMFYCREGVKK